MKKISLVLSGGGARGIAHLGVLEELEKQDYEIHSITGTSMGAVVGGIYAAGKIREFKKWILNLDKIDIFKLVDFTLFNNGFIKGDKVFEAISPFISNRQIQDLPIRYSATATDLVGKKEVLFTEGSLYDALRASIAIPNVLTPVVKEDAILVDGGVVNNIPINHAHRMDNDLLVAVNVNADIPLIDTEIKNKEKESLYQSAMAKFSKNLRELFSNDANNDLNYFDIMNVSFELMRNEMDKISLKNTPPDILIETSRDRCKIYDFYKAEELIALGRKATVMALKRHTNPS
ncbi:patatin-like phospholipase family protein [Aestuariivivens sediminis]|uniref:patatin-like phospholipase family protein n=1 Tax=Aestuariivivens sediminis TaxID=2913557 RepID=UPI001F5ACE38|nr:patatin-like phospholipase family protein [Aestuariivivens sediminis]